MHFDFITLFPDLIHSFLNSSLFHRAFKKGLFTYSVVQLRDFSLDNQKSVDDAPFGGGEGMLLRVDVLHRAWSHLIQNHYSFKVSEDELLTKGHPQNKAQTIYLSPQGRKLDQSYLRSSLLNHKHIVFICGQYEGIDERFLELCVNEEISVGDYILSGGELAALTVSDALLRLIPGVLGNENSVLNDSIERGGLKYPQYTRPQDFRGIKVPEVLLSGHHQEIESWRKKQAEIQTIKKTKGKAR